MAEQFSNDRGRRAFMLRMALLAGSSLVGAGVMSEEGVRRGEGMTVRQVIAALLADIPGAPFPNTVDTIKAGNADQQVTGIVTTMFATYPSVAKDTTEEERGTMLRRRSGDCKDRPVGGEFYYCT